MTGDGKKKVLPGEPLRLTADAFNAMLDAAGAARSQHTGGGQIRETPRATALVKVRNISGADVDRWGVLALGDPTILPADNEDEFQRQVVFDGIAPTGSTPAGKFVVLTEPLPDGAIGLGVLAGVATCKLSVPGALGAFAECENANTTSLVTGSTGTARVLWAESSGTTRWAIVRLGDGSGPALRTVGGSPTGGADVIEFDPADGFVVSQPSAGVARVDIASATATQNGIVDNATQRLKGEKQFQQTDSSKYISIRHYETAGTAVISGLVTHDNNGVFIYYGSDRIDFGNGSKPVLLTNWGGTNNVVRFYANQTAYNAGPSGVYWELNNALGRILLGAGTVSVIDGFGAVVNGDSGTDPTGSEFVNGLCVNIGSGPITVDVTNVTGLGTMATEDAADYLAVANNLSDLASAAAARGNLGLGTIAVEAAGDSDIDAIGNVVVNGVVASVEGSASAARINLGLGTAAVEAIGPIGHAIPMCDDTSVVWSGAMFLPTMTAQAYASGHGAIQFFEGTSVYTGYLAWVLPSTTRLAYLGFDTADLTATMENGADFRVVGGALVLGSGATPTGGGVNCLVLTGGAAPTGVAGGTCVIYCTAGGEAHVIDGSGNDTGFSPHSDGGPDEFYPPGEWAKVEEESNRFAGKRRFFDYLGLFREVERLTGKKLMHEEDLPPEEAVDWDAEQRSQALRRLAEIQAQQSRHRDWSARLDAWFLLPADRREKTPRPADWVEAWIEPLEPKPRPRHVGG